MALTLDPNSPGLEPRPLVHAEPPRGKKGRVIKGVAAILVLPTMIGLAAASIDRTRNTRLLNQFDEDAVVASLPLADGMRPTPIAVVRNEGNTRMIAITLQDARRHRDDLLPSLLNRNEVAALAPPSDMRDAFARDLVQRLSVRLDCTTGGIKPLNLETALSLSGPPTYVGPAIKGTASLPTSIDKARAQVICSLPVTTV